MSYFFSVGQTNWKKKTTVSFGIQLPHEPLVLVTDPMPQKL